MYNNEKYYTIVKQNDLIQRSRFNLTLQEQKILLYIISKIKPTDTELLDYELNIIDFCNVIDIDYKNGAYTKIKKVLKNLADKSFWLNIDEKNELLIRWFSHIHLQKDVGVVNVKLHDELKPYLLQLKEHFTYYELYYILNFRSKYSVQLYELFKSYEYIKSLENDINNLQETLQCNYTRFVDFKRYVVEPALKEINRETDLNVTVEYIKVGRAYKKIKFYIKNKYGFNKVKQL